ncbi:cyclic nucleotide-binding domain-containing protein [Aliidiomarina taiwanensis]|uniref:cyclic nucleotide-binding domain-containing protein n=1 Tax=Aliidiomarina taiwanensis TaxID=946228 RepID=UPI001300B173|nr:cyclic nucleotide-binding domain-containing protein [Aliidiomarina taiwanensis]
MAKTQAINSISELRAVELLSRVPLFKSLSTDDKGVFARVRGLFHLVREGTLFIEQGEPEYSIYIIMSGQARVYKDDILVGEVGPGQFVGEVAFVTREERTASVLATSDLIVMRITADTFRRLPIYARELVKDKMIEGLQQRVEQLNLDLVKHKLSLAKRNEREASEASGQEATDNNNHKE